jgi:hypothetical protein
VTTGNSSQPAHQSNETSTPADAAESLNYRFYVRACELAGETASAENFAAGQAEGQFKFTEDAALLGSLLSLYSINIHQIAGEWLAFASKPGQVSVFAQTPLQAAISWVISQPLDLLTG